MKEGSPLPEPRPLSLTRDEFNTRWNAAKIERRQENVRIAHGYIRTNGGLVYMDHGTPRKRK